MIEIFNFKPYLDESSESSSSWDSSSGLPLSCAIMHHPEVLFLDEPTSGVDPITRREFWNHINGLVQKGVTVMVTTHFMDEAEEYCDQVASFITENYQYGYSGYLKDKNSRSNNPNPNFGRCFY